MDFSQFLGWLAGVGGATVAASWILGQFEWYKKLVEKVKKWIFFGVSVTFGVSAYAGITYIPASTLSAITPYFLIVSGIFILVFINDAYAKLNSVEKSLKLMSMKKK